MIKPRIPFLFIILATLTSCSVLGGDDNETNRPDIPGKIVFSADDDNGISQIYTMKANGADVRQLTHEKHGFESQPSWSPDGQRIIYSSAAMSNTTSPALVIMDADGRNKHLLDKREGPDGITLSLYGRDARWSPDGTKIAYDLCPNCELRPNNDIYIYDIATNTHRKLTQSPASDLAPLWSPDGNRIAFTSRRDYLDADTLRFRRDLYAFNANGSNLQRLTHSGFIGSYIWIDSVHIICSTYDSSSDLKKITELDIKTGKQRLIRKNIHASEFWILWDDTKEQLFTLNKEYEKLPVSIDIYNLKGNRIKKIKFKNPTLQTALGFDFTEIKE